VHRISLHDALLRWSTKYYLTPIMHCTTSFRWSRQGGRRRCLRPAGWIFCYFFNI
jgi:hypothetical protein